MHANAGVSLSDLDRSNLYEIARGFLPLSRPESILRHALLSLMGACGATSAGLWERTGDDAWRLCAFRGAPRAASSLVRLSPSLIRRLTRDPGPHDLAALASLSPTLERWARSSSVPLVCALLARGQVAGLFGLGERWLGEAHGPRERALFREIAGLAGARLSGAGGRKSPAGEGSSSPRGGDAPRQGGSASGQRGSTSRQGASASRQDAPASRPGPSTRADELRTRNPALRTIEGSGPGVRALLQELVDVSPFDFPVLIHGETGTGKELAARALHDLGPRNEEPFEAVNCAAIPRELMASALFGHERGAFTGALGRVAGAFERAGAGTLFLDEIGDMPLSTQTLLLRVLQERSFRRVGGEEPLPARARVISATNRDLVEAVHEGRFRADLFYRIQMYTVRIPPLRERREDLPALTMRILGTHDGRARKTRPSAEFLRALRQMDLPGNVRQLEAIVLGALIRARGAEELRPEHIPEECARSTAPARPSGERDVPRERTASPRTRGSAPGGNGSFPPTYEEMQREYIRSVLSLTGGNRKEAAALMKIPRTTLMARMRKLGLKGRNSDAATAGRPPKTS